MSEEKKENVKIETNETKTIDVSGFFDFLRGVDKKNKNNILEKILVALIAVLVISGFLYVLQGFWAILFRTGNSEKYYETYVNVSDISSFMNKITIITLIYAAFIFLVNPKKFKENKLNKYLGIGFILILVATWIIPEIHKSKIGEITNSIFNFSDLSNFYENPENEYFKIYKSSLFFMSILHLVAFLINLYYTYIVSGKLFFNKELTLKDAKETLVSSSKNIASTTKTFVDSVKEAANEHAEGASEKLDDAKDKIEDKAEEIKDKVEDKVEEVKKKKTAAKPKATKPKTTTKEDDKN